MTQSMWTFLWERLPELITKVYEQLFLAGTATFAAMIISVPLGVWVARNKKIRGPVLAMVNILQTIPSLAVLAFLIPFVGIGVKPAVITLTIYALLPIVRNTATSILNISPKIIEATHSLGFTRMQRLMLVELPIALPMIIVGIRTATTLCVGTATLAAFVGGGGLGDFIYQGLSTNNSRLILLGAIPAALLVLVLDFIIAQFERALTRARRSPERVKNERFKYALVGGVVVLLMIKPFSHFWNTCNGEVIIVGARNQTEQLILGEIIAQSIEQKTRLNVIRKFNLMSASMAQTAIEHSQVDIIPEYTGTAYLVTLKGELKDVPSDLYGYLQDEFQKKYQLTWLPAFGFSNSNALLISEELAKKHNIQTISDVHKIAKQYTIGVSSSFYTRPDGYPGLKKYYGLDFESVKIMELGLLYDAIHSQKVRMAFGSATDGRIESENLRVLYDDKHVLPDYIAAPIIRTSAIKQHPEVVDALKPILGKLTLQKIQELNKQVDIEKHSVKSVVQTFLKS